MFDLLPDVFSKVTLRKALGLTVCFSAFGGVCIGELLMAAVRLHPSTYDYLNILFQTLLCVGLAVRFYVLTLSRIDERQVTIRPQK
jgi:hypothetical protein